MFKQALIGVLCIATAFMLVGCNLFNEYQPYDPGSEYVTDTVIVRVKAEFRDEYDNEEFTKESFQWNNILSIGYDPINYLDLDVSGYIKIYLKNEGREEVINAIEHFETLNFVYAASGILVYSLDRVFIHIKEEYKEEFQDQQFTKEDFEWENIERVKYVSWSGNYGLMSIYLTDHGRQHIIEALEHFTKLYFVKSGDVVGIDYHS